MSETDSDDDRAFMQLLTRNQRNLRAYIVGMTPSLMDADDILQEVNLALWKKRRLYDRDQGFLHWAFGFAAMEVRNFRNRASKSRLWFNDELLALVAEAYPNDSKIVEQRRDALACCVQKLGALERQLITDFYRHRCSAQALSEATGKSLSAIYKTLTRARQSLRICIERTLAHSER